MTSSTHRRSPTYSLVWLMLLNVSILALAGTCRALPSPPATPPETINQKPETPATTNQKPDAQPFTLTSPNDVVYDMERGIAVAEGEVTLTYGDMVIEADRAVVNYRSNLATLSGNLKVTTLNQHFSGRSLTFHLDTGIWDLAQVEAVFPPEFFPPNSVLEPIYVQGAQVTGLYEHADTDRYIDVQGRDFKVSSCDRGHYYFRSHLLEFYRDRNSQPSRIVLRRNSLFLLGQKILPLPVWVISLTGVQRRQGLQTLFGSTNTEGLYAKSAFYLRATPSYTDSVLIDLMQRRGLGLGLQREMVADSGLAYAYLTSGTHGERQFDTRLRKLWHLSSQLQANLNFQSTDNNPFGPGISTRNGDLGFTWKRPRLQSSLLMHTSNTSSDLSNDYSAFSSSFSNHYELGHHLVFQGTSLFNASDSGALGGSRTLDHNFAFIKTARLFDSLLRTELHEDLRRDGIAYQLERQPELQFTSDTNRLPLHWLHRSLPAAVNLTVGRYLEPLAGTTTGVQRDRLAFGLLGQPQTRPLWRWGSWDSRWTRQLQFQQNFYSDHSARYTYGAQLGMDTRMGTVSTQSTWFKQQSAGFTPFQFDFIGPGEYIETSAAWEPTRSWRTTLSGGKDLHNNITRDLVGRVEYEPSPWVSGAVGLSYSPTSHSMGDVVGNLRLLREGQRAPYGRLELGLRYSPRLTQLTRLNVATDLRVFKGTRVQALSSYNGQTRNFDFNQIRLVQDLHCFNLYGTYDSARREFRLDLALKAFPFLDTRFGSNRQGAGFDPFVNLGQ